MNNFSLLISRGIILLYAVTLIIVFICFINYSIGARPYPPLKILGHEYKIQVGNFAIRNKLLDKNYKAILTSEFSFVLADNTPNWYFTDGGLRPSKDSFFFDHMDQVINFAEDNSMSVQAHHFLWGEEKWLPTWLTRGRFSTEELDAIIQNHIEVVGSRYKGRIREWTVVNEAFSRGQHIYGLHDWWADATGDKSYIDKAFIWARKTDPAAKLILNDFQNESINDISNEMYDYIKSALERNVPIDGIGMQMHIDGTHPPTKEEVISNMGRFGNLGLEIYVTEFDVNMNDVQASKRDKNKIQANIYYEMARACIESQVCHSFAILGITDSETWYKHMGLTDPRPLPFDERYRPKPAYFSLRDAFAQ